MLSASKVIAIVLASVAPSCAVQLSKRYIPDHVLEIEMPSTFKKVGVGICPDAEWLNGGEFNERTCQAEGNVYCYSSTNDDFWDCLRYTGDCFSTVIDYHGRDVTPFTCKKKTEWQCTNIGSMKKCGKPFGTKYTTKEDLAYACSTNTACGAIQWDLFDNGGDGGAGYMCEDQSWLDFVFAPAPMFSVACSIEDPCINCQGKARATYFGEPDLLNINGESQKDKSFCYRRNDEVINDEDADACSNYWGEIVGSHDRYPCHFVSKGAKNGSNRCELASFVKPAHYDAQKCCHYTAN